MPRKYTKKTTPKIGGKKKKYSNIIPKYKINNDGGFGSVIMNLNSEESFVIESGALFYIKQKTGKKIEVETKTGGIFSGLKRSLLSGETLFKNYLTAPKGNSAEITFGSSFPGEIIPIIVKPGDTYYGSQGSFLGSSVNIDVKTKFKMRGIFTGEGAFLTKFANSSEDDGLVFLACYGKIRKVSIKKGEEFLVDNGLFLATHEDNKFTVTKLSGYKSFFFGGEGVFMKFKGPCELYVQNRNINDFIRQIDNRLPSRTKA